MINHLKKVFDNYRLKVRDFEDKKFYIGFGVFIKCFTVYLLERLHYIYCSVIFIFSML